MNAIALVLGMALLVFVMALGLGLLMAWPVMWLWNYTVVDLFKFPAMDYWHAWAMFVLCSILFKSGGASAKSSD